MNVLRIWLEEKGAQGRKQLLAELQKKYPRLKSTSISQYAHGKRIPEKGKAEIIARFIGVPLESIPFRMTNTPPCPGAVGGRDARPTGEGVKGPQAGSLGHKDMVAMGVKDSGNGEAGKPKNKSLKSQGLFFFLRRVLAKGGQFCQRFREVE